MSESDHKPIFGISRLYENAQRLYSLVPYKYVKSGRAFPAWHYFFEVTRCCNLRCKMCQYIDWLERVPVSEQKADELTAEEWHRVIDQISRFSLVTFTGGEPFVRKDFMELLTHASRKARTHFISNATLLVQEKVEAVVALAPKRIGGRGLNFIGTSIEGPGELHDEIRRLPGAFKRSVSGIRLLRDARDKAGKKCPAVHVTTVIQKDNVSALHLLPKVIAEAGGDVLNLVTETRMHDVPGFGVADPSTFRTEDVPWPRIDPQQLSEALDRTETAAREAGIELRMPRMPRTDLVNYYDTGINLGDYECRNAWNTLIVGRTGEVCTCWLINAGNVREQSLRKIWNGPVLRQFRQTCQKHLFAVCPGCCFLDHK